MCSLNHFVRPLRMAHPHWSGSMFFDALVHKAGLNCLKSTTTYLPHSCRVNQFIYVEQKIVEKVYLKLHFLFESR